MLVRKIVAAQLMSKHQSIYRPCNNWLRLWKSCLYIMISKCLPYTRQFLYSRLTIASLQAYEILSECSDLGKRSKEDYSISLPTYNLWQDILTNRQVYTNTFPGIQRQIYGSRNGIAVKTSSSCRDGQQTPYRPWSSYGQIWLSFRPLQHGLPNGMSLFCSY